MSTLKDKVLFITGASRGIGLAIAERAARDGAKIAVVGKTAEPHDKLPGTVYSACESIESLGGQALPCVCDIRFEDQVGAAMEATARRFGGVDIVVNNASAIFLAGTGATPMKRFDLMHQVNARGTFVCSQAALPWLEKAENPHILTLSPPLDLKPAYFAPHLAYSLAKFGMSLCVLGLAQELRPRGIAANALWPKTVIATSAVKNLLGGDAVASRGRWPSIVADAAHWILTQPARELTGEFLIDEDVLRRAGVTDLDRYAVTPGAELLPDLFV
jgi:citronellol/citronellal dehydrogenase